LNNEIKLPLLLNDEEVGSELLNDYAALPDSVKQVISQVLIDQLNEMVGRAESCQTPIEQLLGVALEKQMERFLPYDYKLHSQYNLEVCGKKYRADFHVVVSSKGEDYGFVVECDGHDFHEKTKEQARNDKKRDRDLMSLGYTVIHFTGSEIFENPFMCANEVLDLITNQLEK
jgi:very-short-patch-repair endonuclease